MTNQPESDKQPGVTAGITCPTCGTLNRPGELLCVKCGTVLGSAQGGIGTRQFDERLKTGGLENRQTTIIEEDGMTARTDSRMGTAEIAVRTAGSAIFEDNMLLRLEIEGANNPITIVPKYETSIGRRDPATGTMPDIDLTSYAGYRMGVSRMHATIRLRNKKLEVYDLGSSNGTSVNGKRLVPHQPYHLRDGDQLELGKMALRVIFQARS